MSTSVAGRVVIVLVEPLQPGNVGAAARAMRNFGLEELVLVAPPAYDPERARWMAPGCADLLARARIVATLDQALDGVSRLFGTTARHRRLGQTVIEPPELATRVIDDPERATAILFGREDSGLANDAIRRCEALVRIATAEHASLNLAQSVLLVAHHLYEEQRRRGRPSPGRTLAGTGPPTTTADAIPASDRDRLADLVAIDPAVEALIGLLGRVGYLRGTAPDKVRATANQALQQARLSVRHVEALRGMVARIGHALDDADGAPDRGDGDGGDREPDRDR
ncbi:MAG: TrmH family RNA methyltransferase [Myxococcota bacterium]